ncbi:MAG: YlxR family protein [Lachnospiraceae bacterium]|nr:YlxR family protein [Lachnospiraceae bacterium]
MVSTAKTKRNPQRMCIGCREMKDRTELIRIVKKKDGEVFLDETGKGQGRGAYVCRNPECMKRIEKTKGLERAFKMSVPQTIYEALRDEMEEIACRTK